MAAVTLKSDVHMIETHVDTNVGDHFFFRECLVAAHNRRMSNVPTGTKQGNWNRMRARVRVRPSPWGEASHIKSEIAPT